MDSGGRTDERGRSLETLAVLSAACLVLGWLFDARAFGAAALVLLLIALFCKRLAARLSRAWLGFAAGLGALNSRILLTLVYFLVLTPVAFLYRIVHGDVLDLKPGARGRSHWKPRNHDFEARDLERPW